RSLDCRYAGQSYEIDVPYRKARTLGQAFLESFHRLHKRLYSYRHDRRPVEIVNLRIKAVAMTPKIPFRRELRAASLDPQALVKTQAIHSGRAVREGSVYDRSKLRPGNVLAGPALIIDPESTAFLPPGYRAAVDPYLNLVIRKAGSR
ncbi:MAG: hydantoinase/oxoprolinase family protein, partial [Candidatus Aminicenantales bacterium]